MLFDMLLEDLFANSLRTQQRKGGHRPDTSCHTTARSVAEGLVVFMQIKQKLVTLEAAQV